jgi:putative phage-type endonuclease
MPALHSPAVLSDVQLEMRQTGIGASEAAAALGLDAWRTEYELALKKTKPWLLPDVPSVAARRGQFLEPLVADLYAEHMRARGHQHVTLVKETRTLRYGGAESDSILLATPDYYVRGLTNSADRLLEIKTKTWRSAVGFGTPGTDELPDSVILQVQQQMLVTGLTACDVAVLVDDDFRLYHVEANAHVQRALLTRLPAWWQLRVVQNQMPDVDGSKAVMLNLRAMLQASDGVVRQATAGESALLSRLAKLRADAKVIEADDARLVQALCLGIGEDVGVQSDAGKMTFKADKHGKRVARFTPTAIEGTE